MNWLLLWCSLAQVAPVDSCGKPYEDGWRADPVFCVNNSSSTVNILQFSDSGQIILTVPDAGTAGQECLGPNLMPAPWGFACYEPRYVDIYLVDRRLVRFDRLTGRVIP